MQKENIIQHRSNLLRMLLKPFIITTNFKKDPNQLTYRNLFIINKKMHKVNFKAIFNQLYSIESTSLNVKIEKKKIVKKIIFFTIEALKGKIYFNQESRNNYTN